MTDWVREGLGIQTNGQAGNLKGLDWRRCLGIQRCRYRRLTTPPGKLEQKLEQQYSSHLMHVVVVSLIQSLKPNYNRLWALDDWYFRNCLHVPRIFILSLAQS